MASPLHQFEIVELAPIHIGGVNLSYTNSALWMTIAIIVVTTFLVVAMTNRQLVPGRLQSMAEVLYEFIGQMVKDNVGSAGRPYFPFIFSLFVFFLLGNLLGLIPYSFTFTSHLAVTLGMAVFIFLATTVIGFAKHGLHYFSLFLPGGAPIFLAPLLVPIEILSYFMRPLSLALRLFANMTAGHTLMKVFAGFVAMMGVFGVVPLVFVVALFGLETLVAFLQAFVYTILTCIYLNDALHLH
ncbi:MAG: F0F1 ATP synthase subunit A [Rhodospirillales bacterium]|nr:F0F1 ATP synthase subunit A [Rhodospirillales bacterium]